MDGTGQASRAIESSATMRHTRRKATALIEHIREVLTHAIDANGSTISDYVQVNGRSGGFQDRFQVYGRTGQPCMACGGRIKRLVVGQRGTHICPRCQRA